MIGPKLIGLSPATKKRVLMLGDGLSALFSFGIAVVFNLPEAFLVESLWSTTCLAFFSSFVCILALDRCGLYRIMLRHMDLRVVLTATAGVLLCLFSLFVVNVVLWTTFFSPPLMLSFGVLFWFLVIFTRMSAHHIYKLKSKKNVSTRRVIIFGAGAAGAQLAKICGLDLAYHPIAFVDEDQNLWGREICGLSVYDPLKLPELVASKNVELVIIAIPSASSASKLRIVRAISGLGVKVTSMPSLTELIAGVPANKIKEIKIEDLLGRNSVEPVWNLLNQSIRGKNVCITGAGGSIGSELARQAVKFGASTVLLFDQSEYALYSIDEELKEAVQSKGSNTQIVALLGSVLDHKRMNAAFLKFGIQTIYHAAAYKHVPLVQQNVLQGIINNVFGAKITAQTAKECGVERFILISTDKAVRPTNVMGATKRMAELLLQNMASDPTTTTLFSMVRFGNVLASSGSVVPLFKKQIEQGNRITVTHPDVTRYFMTIPEAASLVIQAGSLSKGGEVFVLDMGEPVKIVDLAKTMIRLSGRTIQGPESQDGDVKIEFTGLRPGEKLYEELLVGNKFSETIHPKIMCALEQSLPSDILATAVIDLEKAVANEDTGLAKQILTKVVEGFAPNSDGVDWLFPEGDRILKSG